MISQRADFMAVSPHQNDNPTIISSPHPERQERFNSLLEYELQHPPDLTNTDETVLTGLGYWNQCPRGKYIPISCQRCQVR
jgi:hypothetical protein